MAGRKVPTLDLVDWAVLEPGVTLAVPNGGAFEGAGFGAEGGEFTKT